MADDYHYYEAMETNFPRRNDQLRQPEQDHLLQLEAENPSAARYPHRPNGYDDDAIPLSSMPQNHHPQQQLQQQQQQLQRQHRPYLTAVDGSVQSSSMSSGAETENLSSEAPESLLALGVAPAFPQERAPAHAQDGAPAIPPYTYRNTDRSGRIRDNPAGTQAQSAATNPSRPPAPGPKTYMNLIACSSSRLAGRCTQRNGRGEGWGVSTCRGRLYFLTMCLCLGLAIMAAVMSTWTFMNSGNDSKLYCLPCTDLPQRLGRVGNESLNYLVTTTMDNGQEMCCIDSSDGLAELVTNIRHKEQVERASPQDVTSAHVRLHIESTDKGANMVSENANFTLNLVATDTDTSHYGNIRVGSQTLTILIEGTYFVYSSINYNTKEQSQKCGDLKYKTWLHRIMRTQPGEVTGRPLVGTVHTCNSKCPVYHFSGFAGGTFELSKGDSISVMINAPIFVFDDQESSYLGLYLITGTGTEGLKSKMGESPNEL